MCGMKIIMPFFGWTVKKSYYFLHTFIVKIYTSTSSFNEFQIIVDSGYYIYGSKG